MSLGLCCQYIISKKKRSGEIFYENLTGEQSLQLGRFQAGKYSHQIIKDLYWNNVIGLFDILKRIHREGYSCFRVSSNLLPLFDKVDKDCLEPRLLEKFKEIGDFVKFHRMRLTQHPSQFCVLSSDSDAVIKNSIEILKYHNFVFDAMGLEQNSFYSINIHGGKRNNEKRLADTIQNLDLGIRSRLTLENDESSYSVKKLFEIFQITQVPIVFDSHHHSFQEDGLSGEDAFQLACSTWGDIKPLTHLSNTEPEFLQEGSFTNKRKHSFYIHTVPDYQRMGNNNCTIDIEVEAKGKNLAIQKMLIDLGIKL